MRPLPDDDFEDDEPDEWNLEADDDEEEETAVLPCPSCGAEVYEDAERCPVCGEFIIGRRLRAWEGRPTWWIVLGLVGIGAVVWVLAFR